VLKERDEMRDDENMRRRKHQPTNTHFQSIHHSYKNLNEIEKKLKMKFDQ